MNAHVVAGKDYTVSLDSQRRFSSHGITGAAPVDF